MELKDPRHDDARCSFCPVCLVKVNIRKPHYDVKSAVQYVRLIQDVIPDYDVDDVCQPTVLHEKCAVALRKKKAGRSASLPNLPSAVAFAATARARKYIVRTHSDQHCPLCRLANSVKRGIVDIQETDDPPARRAGRHQKLQKPNDSPQQSPSSPSTPTSTSTSSSHPISIETVQRAKSVANVSSRQILKINTVYRYGAGHQGLFEPGAREALTERNRTFVDLYEVVRQKNNYTCGKYTVLRNIT